MSTEAVISLIRVAVQDSGCTVVDLTTTEEGGVVGRYKSADNSIHEIIIPWFMFNYTGSQPDG